MYTQNFSSAMKDKVMPLARKKKKQLEIITLSELNQSWKNKYVFSHKWFPDFL